MKQTKRVAKKEINIRKLEFTVGSEKQKREYSIQEINRKVYRTLKYQMPYDEANIFQASKNIKDKKVNDSTPRAIKQLNLQRQIQSLYVIKIIHDKCFKTNIEVDQQYFDCLLFQLPLDNLSFENRIKIFFCIANGVKDMKKYFICHRTLNPNNISVIKKENDEYVAKIAHFEYAVKLNNIKQQINSKAQKSSFSAPQIKLGLVHDISCDIWSLGLLLNYILYGTLKNVWQEQSCTKIQVPPGTPSWLLELLKSMLHQSPKKRSKIEQVLQIVKVALKCCPSLDKFVPTGSQLLKFDRVETKFMDVEAL